jgi:hypothetical protein
MCHAEGPHTPVATSIFALVSSANDLSVTTHLNPSIVGKRPDKSAKECNMPVVISFDDCVLFMRHK